VPDAQVLARDYRSVVLKHCLAVVDLQILNVGFRRDFASLRFERFRALRVDALLTC
jgi:hypothetical protein